MSMVVALSAVDSDTIKGFQSLTISITGAAINLVIILIFNFIYTKIAVWLTDKELHRFLLTFLVSICCEKYQNNLFQNSDRL